MNTPENFKGEHAIKAQLDRVLEQNHTLREQLKEKEQDIMLSPKFLSESHSNLFYSVLSQLNESQRLNPEYLAVAFIVSSDDELHEKMNPYFSSNGFNTLTMFEEVDFSSGYRKIAEAAADLFGQDYQVSLSNLAGSLSHDLFHTLLQAMIIRKYGVIG